MDINTFPDELLLQIFHYLPLKDRVRIGGVSVRFRQLSKETIQKLKSLNFDDDLATYTTMTQTLSSLLDSCSPTLERIDTVYGNLNKAILIALSKHSYPKLARFETAIDPCISIGDFDVYERNIIDLITHNRSLKSIILHPGLDFEFPDDVVLENLEKLEILAAAIKFCFHSRSDDELAFCGYDNFLQTLTGRVPNLEYLKVQTVDVRSHTALISLTLATFDKFLASTPRLKSLHLDLNYEMGMGESRFENFWSLSSLTSLELNIRYKDGSSDFYIHVEFLEKISVHFPHLQRFATESENVGVGVLMPLAKLDHLQELRVYHFHLVPEEIFLIINSCPAFSWLDFHGLCGFQNTKEFTDFLRGLHRCDGRKITIRFFEDQDLCYHWVSNATKAALEDVKKETGVEIKFELWC